MEMETTTENKDFKFKAKIAASNPIITSTNLEASGENFVKKPAEEKQRIFPVRSRPQFTLTAMKFVVKIHGSRP
ncbi:unnamed protein product [Linum trigynum]|uniref:Uncharacterized protein n=1 Tax=Linum trigynum TaxID=586398 RepID=A0AAV2EVC7_9ROSI